MSVLGETDAGPPVVVVEGASAKPAVGWKIAGVDAAAVWVTEVPVPTLRLHRHRYHPSA